MREPVPLGHVLDALRVLDGSRLRRVDEQDGELVTPYRVTMEELRELATMELGRLVQRVVTGPVPEIVVDGLEAVEVEEDSDPTKRPWRLASSGARHP